MPPHILRLSDIPTVMAILSIDSNQLPWKSIKFFICCCLLSIIYSTQFPKSNKIRNKNPESSKEHLRMGLAQLLFAETRTKYSNSIWQRIGEWREWMKLIGVNMERMVSLLPQRPFTMQRTPSIIFYFVIFVKNKMKIERNARSHTLSFHSLDHFN